MNKQYLIYLDSLPKLINFVESSNYDDKQKIRCQKLNTIPPIIAFDKEIGGILSEIRLTYIYGCFYCSILGASAFGERILNKLKNVI